MLPGHRILFKHFRRVFGGELWPGCHGYLHGRAWSGATNHRPVPNPKLIIDDEF